MTLDFDPRELRGVFFQEADESLTAMEQALMALEATPDAPEPLNEVFRLTHTIKGGAAMLGLDALTDFAHRFEDALDMMREGLVQVNAQRVTIMLQIVDALRELMGAEMRGTGATRVRAADLALVGRLLPVELQEAGGGSLEAGVEQGEADHHSAATSIGASHKSRSLRVDMAKLDGMLTLSGEIAVAKGRMMELLALDVSKARDEAIGTEAVLSAAEEMGRLLTTLHERVMEMRLVPLGPLFRQHQRTVRDVAAAQGKLIRLALEGEDVEVDATIVEQLRDPLTHLVRNAVDHGIELPAARRDLGKDPCGTITLHARHERGTVIVEIRDDGRGMSREKILAKARERGLVSDGEQLTDAQVFQLVTAPGLSTAAKVTEISGRGVGMDVVRRSVEALRGTLEISSTEGAKSVVRLRLPLTVAIIEGFVVGVSDERYVIPLSSVTECLTAHETDPAASNGVLAVRGHALPYIRLRHLFSVDAERPARESIVIVQGDNGLVGLVVDELLGETQAVIKPLAGQFNQVRGFSGTTIMGDGKVSLILDVAPLLELAHRATQHTSALS